MFITLEGIDGSGKSTLLVSLSEHLREQGRVVTMAREPGGTPVGDAVRGVFLQGGLHIAPLAEALLINASRSALVADVIRPALAAGGTVVCDRYTDSTLAYQGYGRGVNVAVLRTMCETATEGLLPDLTLILDVPVETALVRMGQSGKNDRMDSQSAAFYERARAGFLELAQTEARMRVLDATRSPQQLLRDAIAEVGSTAAA